MERIHKKLGVTLFGRGGERKWVLLFGEPPDFHIYISRGYVKSQISVESKANRPSAWTILDPSHSFMIVKLQIFV